MPTNYRGLLEQTRAAIREIDPRGASDLIKQGAAVIDVREADEVQQGLVPGAVHIPRGFLESRIV
jgi:rhodanese-related sulfurtransferase